MEEADSIEPRLRPIGALRSELKDLSQAPRQGTEGAPDAWLEVPLWAAEALHGLAVGDELILLTWFHQARRDVFQTHPRSDPNRRSGEGCASRRITPTPESSLSPLP
jgi:tRNA (Thr-GGU) A37 N-methylase